MSAIVTVGQLIGGEVLYLQFAKGGSITDVRRTMSPIVMDARKLQFFDGGCLHVTKACLVSVTPWSSSW